MRVRPIQPRLTYALVVRRAWDDSVSDTITEDLPEPFATIYASALSQAMALPEDARLERCREINRNTVG